MEALGDERQLRGVVGQVEREGRAGAAGRLDQRGVAGRERLELLARALLDDRLIADVLELDEPAQRRRDRDLGVLGLGVGPAREHDPEVGLLGHRDHVGRGRFVVAEPQPVPPKERAAGAKARLDLVGDERDRVLAGERDEAGEELGREVDIAALGHHRLDDDRVQLGAAGRERPLDGLELGLDEHRLKPPQLERPALARVPGGHQRGVGAAVERRLEGEDAVAGRSLRGRRRVQSGDPQRLLVGL